MKSIIATLLLVIAFAMTAKSQDYNYKLIDINPPRFYSDSCECFIKAPLSTDTTYLLKEIQIASFALSECQRIADEQPTEKNIARMIFWGIRLKDLVEQYESLR